MRMLVLLFTAFVLSGCASLLPPRDQVQVYRITAPQVEPRPRASTELKLLVDEPSAPRPMQSDRILVFPEPNLLQFYAGARWAVRPPQLVQEQLLDALEAAGLFAGVRRLAGASDGDLLLEGELREFQASYEGAAQPLTRIRLRLHLVDRRSGRRLASREFVDISEPAGSSALAVVQSLDAGLQRVIDELLVWLEQAAGQAEVDRSAS